MAPSHDLKHALLTVADTDRSAADPAADLARARAGARARTRRRFRLTLTGVTTAAVLAVGVGVVIGDLGNSPDPSAVPSPDASAVPSPDPSDSVGPSAAPAAVRLVAKQFEATPYTFDLTPTGWSLQGTSPFAVTIAPDDGNVSEHPDDFRGKLVILFDANPTKGRVIDRDGRRFWVSGDSGYVTLSTRTRAGEPAGVVRIQYPRNAGWDETSMLAFLGSVHVGPGAQHGLG